jgi:Fic family protein
VFDFEFPDGTKFKGVYIMDFTKINELVAELKGMRPLNQTELKRLRDEFIIENTYDSNAIEGSTLTLRETALILQEGVTIAGKGIKEHLDAVGHKEAFEYVIELADKNAPLNERTIKELHSIVLMNDRENAGKYRSIPVRILGAKHTPPQPYLVPVQMEGLIADYEQIKANKHIIEAVAEFHLRFESIHPFIDGNGRTGRLILNLELIKAGLLPVNVKFTDRQRYYSCFDTFALEQTCEPLATLISEYEEEELTKRIAIIKVE